MTVKKINELPICDDKGKINNLVGIDNNDQVRLIPINIITPPAEIEWHVVNITEVDLFTLQMDISEIMAMVDEGGGILHINVNTDIDPDNGALNLTDFNIPINVNTVSNNHVSLQQFKYKFDVNTSSFYTLECSLVTNESIVTLAVKAIYNDGSYYDMSYFNGYGILNVLFESISNFNSGNIEKYNYED
jgi:hypothetical protein